MLNRAIFLDRDGTINYDPGYLSNPKDLVLFSDSGKVLSFLKNQYQFILIVISNQSGIARGLMSEQQVIDVNNELNKQLAEFNVQIDAFYFCPFHPDFSSEEECECRKPSPSMIFKAAKDFNIDLKNSYFIGDSHVDIEAAKNANLKSILVKTGKGLESFSILQKENNFPTFVAENLKEACSYIIKDAYGVSLSD